MLKDHTGPATRVAEIMNANTGGEVLSLRPTGWPAITEKDLGATFLTLIAAEGLLPVK